MQRSEFIFVVLVYRNTEDPAVFLRSLKESVPGAKTVLVNSFYDDESAAAAQKLATEYGCDFIAVGNNGYGAGNNAGIRHAIGHYDFDWLAVCNPDVEIQHWVSPPKCAAAQPCVYGPGIRTLTGKRQNPCMVFHSPLREALMKRYALRPGSTLPFYAAVALNKLERIVYNLLFSRRKKRVYSLHGSFLLFSRPALDRLGEPFDPGMFLFREEDYLARRAKQLRIPMICYPHIRVLHREDGSVRFISGSVREHTIASLRRYFGIGSD